MMRDILLLQKRELETRLKEKYVERSVDSQKLGGGLINVIIDQGGQENLFCSSCPEQAGSL